MDTDEKTISYANVGLIKMIIEGRKDPKSAFPHPKTEYIHIPYWISRRDAAMISAGRGGEIPTPPKAPGPPAGEPEGPRQLPPQAPPIPLQNVPASQYRPEGAQDFQAHDYKQIAARNQTRRDPTAPFDGPTMGTRPSPGPRPGTLLPELDL